MLTWFAVVLSLTGADGEIGEESSEEDGADGEEGDGELDESD